MRRISPRQSCCSPWGNRWSRRHLSCQGRIRRQRPVEDCTLEAWKAFLTVWKHAQDCVSLGSSSPWSFELGGCLEMKDCIDRGKISNMYVRWHRDTTLRCSCLNGHVRYACLTSSNARKQDSLDDLHPFIAFTSPKISLDNLPKPFLTQGSHSLCSHSNHPGHSHNYIEAHKKQ
jgi:hypothetical protein